MQTLIRRGVTGAEAAVDLDIVEESEEHPGFALNLALEDTALHAEGEDLFEALLNLRKQLEVRGLQILLNGSARNVWPSAMARAMGDVRLSGPTWSISSTTIQRLSM